jgi:hypothetical protein
VSPDVNPAQLHRALAEGGPELLALIFRHQLGPLWHARAGTDTFTDSHRQAALLYMRQVAAVRTIDRLFSEAGILYAVIKGVATRERLFDDPAVRLCSDIDILVSPAQRVEAARVLVAAGYRLKLDPSVVSHEVLLATPQVAIDLHWDILRPGRTRVPVTEGLLARRQQRGGWWMLADDDALFVMLVHNAVSKHVSSAQMALHRVADIARWWQCRAMDWPGVHDRLSESGLKAAAWTVLVWVRMLAPSALGERGDAALESLRPGAIRAGYLSACLKLDLSARLTNLHTARLLGFSLLLHDRPTDAWHALQGWRRSRTTSQADARQFEDLVT